MAKVVLKAGALLAPVPPVMVSCGDMESSNIMTVAWTGMLNTIPPKTYISVRPSRHSYDIIRQSGEFVINLTPASLVREADLCGIYTGRKVDKFARCGFTKAPAVAVSCPLIAECPLSLECRVSEVVPLGTHDMIIADILCVDVDEELLDASGRLCLERAGLAAYMHGEYFELGRKIGEFGFSARKSRSKSKARSKAKARVKEKAKNKE